MYQQERQDIFWSIKKQHEKDMDLHFSVAMRRTTNGMKFHFIGNLSKYSSQHLLVQTQQWKHRNNMWILLKVNN